MKIAKLKIKNYLIWLLFLALLASLLPPFARPARAGLILKLPSSLGLATNLVGYWTFDGNDIYENGTVAADKSGNGNTGTITTTIAGVTKTMGKIGQGLSFNGNGENDNYVNVSSDVIGAGTHTICTWAKINSGSFGNMIGATLDVHIYFQLVSNGEEYLKAMFSNDGTSHWPGTEEVLAFNIWNHICVLRNSNGTVTFYINGSQSGTPNQNAGTAVANTGYRIGAGPDGGGDTKGIIDDYRIYNRALSANEIKRLNNMGTGLKVGVNVAGSVTENNPANSVIGLVRQDCSGYSNCSTSLSAWQTMMLGGSGPIDWTGCTAGDLTCVNKVAVAKIDGAWTSADTTAVSITGWTTDSDDYIKIYTTAAARHNGKWNATKYRLAIGNWEASLIDIAEVAVRIDGLQFATTGDGKQHGLRFHLENAGEACKWYVSNNIFYKQAGEFGSAVSLGSYDAGNSYVYNNIFIDVTTGVSTNDWSNSTHYIYNNTFHSNTTYGINRYATAQVVSRNNLFKSNAADTYNLTAANQDYNATNNASLGYTAQTHDRVSQAFTFVNEAGDDFHLSSADSGAKSRGVDLSANSNLAFRTDIDNQIRTAPWDIGADQIPKATVNKSPTNSLTTGLVGYWTFDGPDIYESGTVAADKSGNGNRGTITGATKVAGKIGQALSFDANDYISVPQTASLDTIYNNGGGGMSVAFWMKSDSLAIDSGPITLGWGSDAEWYFRTSRDSHPGRVDVVVNYDGGTDLTAEYDDYTITAGKWDHYIFTWNGGPTAGTNLILYKNGVKLTVNVYSTNGVGNPVDNVGEELLIGSNYLAAGSANGLLDDVRIYNRALSASEVLRLYNMGR